MQQENAAQQGLTITYRKLTTCPTVRKMSSSCSSVALYGILPTKTERLAWLARAIIDLQTEEVKVTSKRDSVAQYGYPDRITDEFAIFGTDQMTRICVLRTDRD